MSLILVSFIFSSVRAYNFPPDPPPYIVNQNIHIAISSTLQKTFFINVTKYAPRHFLQNITISFSEPITVASLIISLLSDKPPNLSAPSNVCVLQYYYIRTYVELEGKIRNVVMNFAINKNVTKSMDIKEEDLNVYRSYGQDFKKCNVEKVITDNYIYLNVSAEGLGYFAVAGVSFSLEKIILIMAATTVIATTVVAFIFYKFKFKLRCILKKNPWRDLFGL